MRNSISEVEFICIFADNLSDIMDEVGTVSYTHLDVYKRQLESIENM